MCFSKGKKKCYTIQSCIHFNRFYFSGKKESDLEVFYEKAKYKKERKALPLFINYSVFLTDHV